MIKMNLRVKLLSGYSLMGVLLVVCGWAGYSAARSMSEASDFLVHEARETVEGALRTVNAVRAEIHLVEEVLAGRRKDDAAAALEQAESVIRNSFAGMTEAGLLPSEQLQRLTAALKAYEDALHPLLKNNQAQVASYDAMIDNANRLNTRLISLLEKVNRVIEQREMNWDTNAAANSQQTEEWFAASAVTEARLALFARLYYFQQFLTKLDDADLVQRMSNSESDLQIYIDDLASMQLTQDRMPGGERAWSLELRDLFDDHKARYAQARQDYLALQSDRQAYASRADELMRQTDHIQILSRGIIDDKIADINDIRSSAFTSILVSVVIGALLVAVSYLVSVKTIVNPVREVADKLRDISEGEGDLTHSLKIAGNDEITDLSRRFNAFMSQVRELIVQLAHAIEQLGATSGRLTHQSGETLRQMTRQQEVSDGVSAAMDDMGAKVDSVCDAAEKAERSMQEMDATLASSQQVIGVTLDSIHEFVDDIHAASEVIDALNQDSQQIGSVLDVIQGIAEQTNLLALNAAIEAARAGEQGRGFAVVADEVRTLASRTQDSTTEIKAIIERLQAGSSQAVKVMSTSQKKAEDTSNKTSSASESLSSITQNIRGMGQIIGQITEAATSQNQQADLMHQNMANIRKIAEGTATSSQDMSVVTRELNDLALQLQAIVGRFKV